MFAQVANRRLTPGRDVITARAQEIYTDNNAAALGYLAGTWEPVATVYAELAGTGRTGGAHSMASLAWTWRGLAWITFARWPLRPATVRPSGEKHAA